MPFERLAQLLGRRKRADDDEPELRPSPRARTEVEVGPLRRNIATRDERSFSPASADAVTLMASSPSLSEASLDSPEPVRSPASAASAPPIGKGPNIGLAKLHEPEDPNSAIVDIFFVHGLTGNAYSTWLHQDRETKTYWPYDLLPKDYPDARILAFDYDADITQFWGPASSNRVGNHAENLLGALSRLRAKTNTDGRKIIFIAHSLGGLVTECALNLSRSSPQADIRSIEQDTLGIAFLGTPHHGSDYAAWVTFASNMTKWIKTSNRDIVAVLQPDSEVLANVGKGFQGLLSRRSDAGDKIAVVCFYEELPVKGLGHIVPKHSAILPAYPSYGIRANHMDMTKFTSARNSGYEVVEGEIFKWIKGLRSCNRQAFSSNLQEEFLQSLEFHGMANRQDLIEASYPDTLHWIWTRPHIRFKEWLQSGTGLFWIAGKAGSGKSTIMKHLADTPSISLELQNQEAITGKGRNVVVAACFLDYKGSRMAKSAEGMLRTLLYHVVSLRSNLFHVVEDEFRRMKQQRGGIIWNLRILETCLLTIIQHSPQTRFFFLVDALDEYEGEDAVVAELFTSISEACTKNLQLCVSSRPHIDFREQLNPSEMLLMENETGGDIRKYTSGIFEKFIQRHGDTYRTLVNQIIVHAQGLFIWVKLASRELLRAAKRGEDIESLLKRLQGMPQELDDIYQRILDQLDPEDRNEARTMLAITISTPEHLTPLQLRYAVHATGKYTDFNTYLAETRILAVCGGLLEFEETDSSYEGLEPMLQDTHSTKGYPGIVRLAHHTVFQFLSKSAPETLEATETDGKLITGNVLLLNACINALVDFVEQTSIESLHEERGRASLTLVERDWPGSNLEMEANARLRFYVFVLRWWITCAQNAEWETNQVQLVIDLLETKNAFSKWRQITVREKMAKVHILGFTVPPSDDTTFHFNSIPRLGRSLPCLERRPDAVESNFIKMHSGIAIRSFRKIDQAYIPSYTRTTYLETIPITLLEFMASCGLNQYSVEILRRRLSSVHCSAFVDSEEGKRLLFAAARGGSIEVVQTLFAAGLKIEFDDEWTSGCLSRAIFHRHLTLAELFITHGAHIYRPGRYHQDRLGSPMEVAVKHLNRGAMELLIAHGFGINARISYWGNAWQLLSKNANENTANFLLDNGANPDLPLPEKNLHYLIYHGVLPRRKLVNCLEKARSRLRERSLVVNDSHSEAPKRVRTMQCSSKG